MNEVIKVTGLCKTYQGHTVVDHIDLQVKPGEIYGFLGPNGSGKTTTIRMICGLVTPDAGSGHCLGHDIITQAELIKLKVGYMTQHFSLYQDLSVYENLEFVARLYRMSDRRRHIDKAIARLGISRKRQKQLAGNLSGGWKQRLALAAATLHQPEVLLLDEPTAGVDPKARRDFWDEIHRLANEDDVTTLVSTHYMDEAERCHRLAYIAYGKLLVTGTQQQVIAHAGLETWEATGERLADLAHRLAAVVTPEQVSVFGQRLHVSAPQGSGLGEILQPYRSDSAYRWRQIEAGLEDVFIYLMTRQQDNFST